jgi:hypothetical protein
MKKSREQFKVDGKTHVVDKHGNKFKVHHPNGDGTYTLDATNITEAKQAVKDWHRKHG